MQLVKEGVLTEVTGSFDLTSLEDVISLMINYYQSTFIHVEDWLTKQERRFFTACVIISNQGLRYTSNESKRIFKNIFNLRRQSDVRGYLSDLEDKGFLLSDVNTKLIQLPEFFKFDLNTQVVKFDIMLNFKNDKVR